MTRRFPTRVIVALSSVALAACGSDARRDDGFKQGAGVGGASSGSSGTGAEAANGSTSSTTSSGMGGSVTSATGTGAGGGAGGSDPWAGPIEALKELDLGDVPLQTSMPFPIPDKTLGFVAVAEAPSLDEAIGIYRLRPPVGTSVIFDYSMLGHTTQYFANKGWLAGADPQSDSADAVPVQEGDWRIVLGDDDASIPSGHVRVWVRRTEDGNFHGGVMDLNVWIAPGVADSGYMNSVLGGMFAGSYAGITLGTVQYFALPDAETVIETHDEYRQMLAGAAVGGTPVVNLFVVADFGDGDFNGAIGVAGGIPGIPMKGGTTMSGVAYQPSGNASYDATVLMHEIGHLGGLFHTTEFQVTETDPLSDTPECDNATINSNPNACADQSNVMFPIAYGATAFTNAQLRVLQGSALYRGILQDGGPPAPPMLLAPAQGSLPTSGSVGAWRSGGGAAPRSAPAEGALERVLGGVWCGESGLDYNALAIRVAGRNPAGRGRLRTIALDAGAAPLVRARALYAWVRATSEAAEPLAPATALAERLAGDPAASTEIRIAALRALRASAPTRGLVLARALAAGGDPIVRAVARRISAP